MFDSGATVSFAIFMAFWGKLHALCHLDSFNFGYPPACLFPVLSLKHSNSPLFANNILYMCDKPIF